MLLVLQQSWMLRQRKDWYKYCLRSTARQNACAGRTWQMLCITVAWALKHGSLLHTPTDHKILLTPIQDPAVCEGTIHESQRYAGQPRSVKSMSTAWCLRTVPQFRCYNFCIFNCLFKSGPSPLRRTCWTFSSGTPAGYPCLKKNICQQMCVDTSHSSYLCNLSPIQTVVPLQ